MIGHGVAYCASCDGMFYKDKIVVVVGGGNSAVSDAVLLSRIAKKSSLFIEEIHYVQRKSTMTS